MKNLTFLFRMDTNGLKNLFNILIYGICVFYCQNILAQTNCSPQTTFTNFQFEYSQTNAVNLTTHTVVEDTGVQYLTIQVYTFTIPYFQNQLEYNYLRFKNGVSSYNCKQQGSGISCGSKIKVFNSHSGGTLIASVNNISQLDITTPLSAGTHNLRVEGTCGVTNLGVDNVYKTAYYRIIVQKEAIPSINLTINTYCQQDNQGQNTGWVGFRANGTKPANTKLSLRAIPPSGSSCSTSDVLIDNLSGTSTISNALFYSCNSNGTYTVKMVYKSSTIGGGFINQEVSPPGWTEFTWTKTFRHCSPIISLPPDRESRSSSPSIYPNPSKEQVTLLYQSKSKKAQIQIFDMNNTMVQQFEADNRTDSHSLSISHLKKGIYILRIIDGDEIFTERIVKE